MSNEFPNGEEQFLTDLFAAINDNKIPIEQPNIDLEKVIMQEVEIQRDYRVMVKKYKNRGRIGIAVSLSIVVFGLVYYYSPLLASNGELYYGRMDLYYLIGFLFFCLIMSFIQLELYFSTRF